MTIFLLYKKNSINTEKFQMREVGGYSVDCSGYGHLVVSHSHNNKISGENRSQPKAELHSVTEQR